MLRIRSLIQSSNLQAVKKFGESMKEDNSMKASVNKIKISPALLNQKSRVMKKKDRLNDKITVHLLKHQIICISLTAKRS